jgi:hypothetical protein
MAYYTEDNSGLFGPRPPGDDEAVCAGCKLAIREWNTPGLDTRITADGSKFCGKCPACPCGREDCDADEQRKRAPHESMWDGIFAIGPDNHYILAEDRPCGFCGLKSHSFDHLDQPRPRPTHGCWVCKTCIHARETDPDEMHDAVKLLVVGPILKQWMSAWVHLKCLYCPTCDYRETRVDKYTHDFDRNWALTKDHALLHVACAPCEFCYKQNARGKRCISAMPATEDSGQLHIVHQKHEKEIIAAFMEKRAATARTNDAIDAIKGLSLGVRPVAVKQKGIPRSRRKPGR